MAALITGFSISSVYAEGRDAAWENFDGTLGPPAPCEMVMDRGGPGEVCGTIFLGHELTKEDVLAK